MINATVVKRVPKIPTCPCLLSTSMRLVGMSCHPAGRARVPAQAVEVLRTVLIQNYCIRTDARGREVITRREADTDGLPPGRLGDQLPV
jgi:hypothetical protein